MQFISLRKKMHSLLGSQTVPIVIHREKSSSKWQWKNKRIEKQLSSGKIVDDDNIFKSNFYNVIRNCNATVDLCNMLYHLSVQPAITEYINLERYRWRKEGRGGGVLILNVPNKVQTAGTLLSFLRRSNLEEQVTEEKGKPGERVTVRFVCTSFFAIDSGI